MFMPVIFSFMFYRMPAGLVLYFAANAIFGMVETWYIRKYLIKPPAKPAAGPNATATGNAVPAK
jgi:membrane protein insertase Oxa1/YidC/SpoIIIJ